MHVCVAFKIINAVSAEAWLEELFDPSGSTVVPCGLLILHLHWTYVPLNERSA